jgi:cytochrome bd-type quinol oxidase subunit 1
MEEITYSHIPIATIITAFMILAPIFELIGRRKNDLRYDRFSKSLIWFSLIIFSPGAALGTGIPMAIIGLYPEFWARWSNLFFWPLIGQFVFFLFEITFLFFFVYLVWDRWQGRKKVLHIVMGFIAAFWGLTIQFVWDAVGAYMMTPNGVDLPGALESVGWNAQAFFNPSLMPLFWHRFFGNISYTMLLTGGVFALKYLRAKEPKEIDYFGFASDLAFTTGFISFFAMPFIGWAYSSVLENHAPNAFNAIMGGHASKYFYIKMAGIAFFLIVGSIYVFVRHRKKTWFLIAVTALVSSLYIVLTLHPPLRWWPGGPIVWRLTYTVLMGGFIFLLWYLRGNAKEFDIKRLRWPWAMFLAGLAAFLVFAMGGFTRERARAPYTVYGILEKEDVTVQSDHEGFLLVYENYDSQRATWLVYENCLNNMSVPELKRIDVSTWSDQEIIDNLCGAGDYSDREKRLMVMAIRERVL